MSECTCIQDESREWINCPVHGMSYTDRAVKAERELTHKSGCHIISLQSQTWGSYWQCDTCFAITPKPSEHHEWHLDMDNKRVDW